VIQQVGTPMEIYERPANLFVAGFVGTPKMNVAPVTLAAGAGADAVVTLGDGTTVKTRVARADLPKDGALRLGLRAEAISVVEAGKGDTKATVEFVERLGDRTLVYLKLSDGAEFVAEDKGASQVAMGDKVGVAFDGAHAHLFDAESRGYHARKGAAG
jgi:multiple sugar transport system ATP-binding protein